MLGLFADTVVADKDRLARISISAVTEKTFAFTPSPSLSFREHQPETMQFKRYETIFLNSNLLL
jgi:hypothetical protein